VRLLGVDPGTRTVGWGVIETRGRSPSLVACGACRAPKGARGVPERLAALADALGEVVHEHRPDAAAVERAFFGKNAEAALRVGEARGAILACLAREGVPVHEVTPAEVKRAVTGTGAAHKTQVQTMTAAVLGLDRPPEPLDASDAVAAAVSLAHRLTAPGGPPRPARRAGGRGSRGRQGRPGSFP
jgi:crossover junction endodeoxyribonuclease RuvC